MGHQRGQFPPNTVAWLPVVASVAEGAPIEAVAATTMEAAKNGLEQAKADKGLSRAVWLMSRLVLAAREDGFSEAAAAHGIDLPSHPSALDVVAAFSDAMDSHLSIKGGRTDIGEMAQLAGAETISTLIGRETTSLFATSPEEVQAAVRAFSTKAGFSEFAHVFFARLTERYLGYHLSRELSQHVGQNQRFSDPTAHTAFLEQLGDYSRQVALIVKEYAGGWYSKSSFETGVSERSAKGFSSRALGKIQDELKRRGSCHVS